MKLLTDFDGVWTDPSNEAHFIADIIVDQVTRLTESDRPAIQQRLDTLRQEILAAPTEHGWESAGALSAYADEDPYILNNAVCRDLARNHPDLWCGIVKEFANHSALSVTCYDAGAARQARHAKPLMRAEAPAMLQRLLSRQWEIVFVSNSSDEKLHDCLGDLSQQAGGPIRVRGSAQKYRLTSPGTAPSRQMAGRPVRIDRDSYYQIIKQEQPDVIIGDVLSLDLALPLAMRSSTSEHGDDTERFAAMEIALMRNSYTPDWALAALGERPGTTVVEGLEPFVDWLLTRHR